MQRFDDGRDWFFARRFGMFAHWGLYAIPAWHEQSQWRQGVPRAEYEPLMHQFNPVDFDPEAWLDLLQEAGMEYLCITTKHHDGFCLWDTHYTDFNVMHSPYGRDIVGMLAQACQRRGVPLCLYYSVVDWHHPNYPNQRRHHELSGPVEGGDPDWDKYMAFLQGQVRELCTNYGEIHGFWWDMNVPGHRDLAVNAMIRALQPKAVINDRGFDAGDFTTPERRVPEGRRFTTPTEACQSLGRESWGYRHDEDYFARKYLLQSIDKIRAMGGNYLLNVGPRADGTIPDEQRVLLRSIGAWYQAVREAFDGVESASSLTTNEEVLLTRNGNTLYLHLYEDSPGHAVMLEPLMVRPRAATLLNTGLALEAQVELTPASWKRQWDQGRRGAEIQAYLRISGLPVDRLTDTVMIAKLEFDDLSRVTSQ